MMLHVDRLAVTAETPDGPRKLVDDVSLTLAAGETLGIVGESGSGKSMLALAVIGLLPEGVTASGRILLDGKDLVVTPESEMCGVRGASIGMIFQEPMTALNPAMRIGDQIAEGILLHRGCGRSEARAEALRLMEQVRFPEPQRRFDFYPHELSGGQRQRVGIAIALALRPRLLIADEPTTALDTTVQADVLDLIADLVTDLDMGLLLISHDFGVIAALADRTMVMYAGTRVEEEDTRRLLHHPRHPYTRGLIAAVPTRGRARKMAGRRLSAIPGTVPQPGRSPPGCRYSDRCAFVLPACQAAEPPWENNVRCIRVEEIDR